MDRIHINQSKLDLILQTQKIDQDQYDAIMEKQRLKKDKEDKIRIDKALNGQEEIDQEDEHTDKLVKEMQAEANPGDFRNMIKVIGNFKGIMTAYIFF